MSRQRSKAERLATHPQRQQILDALTPDEITALQHDWQFWSRPNQQQPDGDWYVWTILAGRGYGKTRTGAETVHQWAADHPGCRIAIVGRTSGDIRRIMINGDSGLIATNKPDNPCRYEQSQRQVVWANGSIGTIYDAIVPEQLMGVQHHYAWCDELAAWRYGDTWDHLLLGLRLGDSPRCIVTTTPKPKSYIMDLVERSAEPDSGYIITRGSTYDNAANLPSIFLDSIRRKYEGTTMGQQELYGELVNAVEGAMITREDIRRLDQPRDYQRIVVAVDPAVTSNAKSDETGIVVAGLHDRYQVDILGDYTLRATPQKWAQRVISVYEQHEADRVIGEVNNGGDLIPDLLQRASDHRLPFTSVRATRGKQRRAEPVAALYEQGRIHHIGDPAQYRELENQLTTWTPDLDWSPDRMDALVWAVTYLTQSGTRKPSVSF